MAEVIERRVVSGDPASVAAVLTRPDGWLDTAAHAAGEGGQAVDMKLRAEMGRAKVKVPLSKRVRLEVGPPQRLPVGLVVPLTWEATGFAGLFPVMDALLELHEVEGRKTELVFWGRYDPPLGRVGDLTDRFVAHRVAEATVRVLLDGIERQMDEETAKVD